MNRVEKNKEWFKSQNIRLKETLQSLQALEKVYDTLLESEILKEKDVEITLETSSFLSFVCELIVSYKTLTRFTVITDVEEGKVVYYLKFLVFGIKTKKFKTLKSLVKAVETEMKTK